MFSGLHRTYRRHLSGKWHLLGAAAFFGMLYALSSAIGLPFLVSKVLPAAFGGPEVAKASAVTFPDWVGLEPWSLPAGHEVAFAVAFLPLVFLVRGCSQWLANTCVNLAGLRVIESVRSEVFARVQRLPLGFFSRVPTGDLMQRLTSDAQSVRIVLVDVTNDILIQPLTLLLSLSVVVVTCLGLPQGWKFLLCLVVVPVSVLIVRAIGRNIRSRARAAAAAAADLNAIAIENLQSPREIRAYNLEQREVDRFSVALADGLRIQSRIVRYDKALSPLLEFVAATGIAFAVWVGADVGLDLQQLLGIITALYIAYEPIKRLGRVSNLLRVAEVGLSRLAQVLDAPDEVPDAPSSAPLGQVKGALRLEAVTFTYGRETVLHSVNISIPAGQSVALVGPSGAGKSTLINLIPRFFDPSSGTVQIDGRDLRNVRLADLRGAIALVSQEPVLFNGSVRDNIRLGKPDADDAAVERAAAQAGALEFIQSLPAGFETRVGERGSALSGGQRQRVAIARAFLKDAPILLLDEATSALDTDTERSIQASLSALMRGRTTLIVAHRFSTIRDVDRILVLDRGEIVADGTRDQVYAENVLFRRLWDQQAAGPA